MQRTGQKFPVFSNFKFLLPFMDSALKWIQKRLVLDLQFLRYPQNNMSFDNFNPCTLKLQTECETRILVPYTLVAILVYKSYRVLTNFVSIYMSHWINTTLVCNLALIWIYMHTESKYCNPILSILQFLEKKIEKKKKGPVILLDTSGKRVNFSKGTMWLTSYDIIP